MTGVSKATLLSLSEAQLAEGRALLETLVTISKIIAGRDDIFDNLSMGEISVAEPNDAVAVALRSMIHTGTGVSLKRFGPVMAKGVYFETGLACRVLSPVLAPRP